MKVIPCGLFNYSKSEHYRRSLKQFLNWAEASQLETPRHFHPENIPDPILEQLAYQALSICDPEHSDFDTCETDFLTFLALVAYCLTVPGAGADLNSMDKLKKYKIFLGYSRAVLSEYFARIDGLEKRESVTFYEIFNVSLDSQLEQLLSNS